jgi:hypothetical protein
MNARRTPAGLMAAVALLGLLPGIRAADQSADRLAVAGFQHPESVVHDTMLDLYLVSNVGELPPTGFPGALDHNGFISRVSPDGVIVDLKWIQDGINGVTLNSPKGIYLYRRELYVADVDTLRVFDRFTGYPLRNVAIPNPFAPSPLFLNDTVVDSDGTVYLTDNQHSAIFTVDREGRASVLASGPELGNPNGILADESGVSWVTFFGHEVKRRKRSGKIVTEAVLPAVDVSGLELAPGVPLPTGALLLDGYGRFDGSLLVSSWVTGKIYLVGRSGKDMETLAEVKGAINSPPPDGPADLDIDRGRNRLLLPLFNANQLLIIPFKD